MKQVMDSKFTQQELLLLKEAVQETAFKGEHARLVASVLDKIDTEITNQHKITEKQLLQDSKSD